jgi:hypothetical protein
MAALSVSTLPEDIAFPVLLIRINGQLLKKNNSLVLSAPM